MRLFSPHRWSLSVKLPLTITAVIASVACTVALVILIDTRAELMRTLDERAVLLGRAVGESAAEPVISHDYWAVYKAVKLMTSSLAVGERDGRVLSAVVLDVQGRVMAHLDPGAYPVGMPFPLHERGAETLLRLPAPQIRRDTPHNGRWIESIVPILSAQEVVGTVRIRMSTGEIAEQTVEASIAVLGWTVLLAGAGSILGTVISNRLIRPLKALGDAMDKLKTDELTVPVSVDVSDEDEIGHLVARFNGMAAELVEKRRIEQELAAAERLSALGRIAAGVAHEINNPLGGMLNCLNNLKRHRNEPELVGRYVPLLERGLTRIEAIVKALLVEVRAEQSETLGSCDCLDDVRDLIVAEIGGRPIELRWTNEVSEVFPVNCQKVQQVILNLLRNAVQAMPAGGVVSFRAAAAMGRVVFEVGDTGVGIPQENLPRIFDPFFTTRAGGTGLGLWMVYRLVESMGGGIEVTSEPGKGTLVRVSLPIAVRELSEPAHARA